MGANTVVAAIVFILVVVFFIYRHQIPLYFTEWVLFLFMLYLGVYLLGLTNPVVDATIFTLCLAILVGFVVIFLIDRATSAQIAALIKQHPGQVVVLFIVHLVPILTLVYLNWWPKAVPSIGFIVTLTVVYFVALYAATGFGPVHQYQLPKTWWSTLVLPLVMIFTVTLVGLTPRHQV